VAVSPASHSGVGGGVVVVGRSSSRGSSFPSFSGEMSGVFIGECSAEDGGDSSESGNVEYEHNARLSVRLELEVSTCADRGSVLLFFAGAGEGGKSFLYIWLSSSLARYSDAIQE